MWWREYWMTGKGVSPLQSFSTCLYPKWQTGDSAACRMCWKRKAAGVHCRRNWRPIRYLREQIYGDKAVVDMESISVSDITMACWLHGKENADQLCSTSLQVINTTRKGNKGITLMKKLGKTHKGLYTTITMCIKKISTEDNGWGKDNISPLNYQVRRSLL